MDVKETKLLSPTNKIVSTIVYIVLLLACFYCGVFVFPWGNDSYIGALAVVLVLATIFTWIRVDEKNKFGYFMLLVLSVAIAVAGIIAAQQFRVMYINQQVGKYGVITQGQIVNVYTRYSAKGRDRKVATLAYRADGEALYQDLDNKKGNIRKYDKVKLIYSSKDPDIFSVLKIERSSAAQLNTDNRAPGTSTLRGIPKPVTFIDHPPQFPGDMPAFYAYLRDHVHYPQQARDQGISGKVFISFVITEDGSVEQVKVEKGIGGGCDEAAIETVTNMPKWKPGVQNGKPVRVKYNIPISFSL